MSSLDVQRSAASHRPSSLVEPSITGGVDKPSQTLGAPKLRRRATERTTLIRARGVKKTFRKGKLDTPVLKGADFSVAEGEFVTIVGKSGSGKTTLLHLLGTLDRPDEGEITFDGKRIDELSRREQDRFRNREIGIVFQFYHLLPELTTLENVLLPTMIQDGLFRYWSRRKVLRERAQELLERVGLGSRLKHRPKELSGGEMQRTAIARALLLQPKALLADEPTGNLDVQTGRGIMDLLLDLHRDGLTVVMVTHDSKLAAEADRTVELVEGRVRVG
ncbi:MAG TPA: ABC transporter ATP-binding protein [Pirellulaceae bacterium]|jgi:lipoprotein-releasing system ATP-binding protein|nr:ABC transporter ATP-binding protein [Pirellulaceae bacterium]